MRRRLQQLTGGAPAGPLLVLFGLNMVDEFDRIAFAWLTPEIRDAFGLTDAGVGAIGVIAGGLVLLAALPMGYLADRRSRVRIALGAALLWGSMSLLTGVVPAVALLFVVRLLSGMGRVANEIVHPSLLTDYYDKAVLPRVFQVHRLANPLSAIGGIAAGAIAATVGWRWSFILLSLPTFALLVAASRLPEPRRGALPTPTSADALQDAPLSFLQARRELFGVRSLRRIWAASLFNGAAIIATPQLLALFFEDVYAYGPFDRGVVSFLYGAGIVTGIVVGGALAHRAVQRDRAQDLALVTGLSGLWVAGGMLLMALAPVAGVSAVAVFVFALGAGSFQPGYYPLVGLVSGPRVRSQAYAYAILFLAVGAFGSIALFGLGDAAGYRPAIVALAASVGLAGAISASARRFVRDDIARAEASLQAQQDLRRESDAGAPLLRCVDVQVAYGQVQVLFGVDLEVHPGEIVALLGTNGAGKSTLLRAVSGLNDPIGGTILFDGQDITHADPRQTARLGLTQVPGGHAVFPTLTVAEHLRLAAWLQDDPDRVLQATDNVLGMLPRLRERLQQPAGNLSGGEQQMLAIGMALVARPRLLMIDELSLGLAPAIVADLLQVVRDIADQGTAVVIVEQSVNVALALAERAYFLEKGEVRFHGPTADLLEREDILRSVFLQGATRGMPGDGSLDRPTAPTRVAGSPRAGVTPVLLAVEHVTKRFGGITAVDDVGLTVAEGEVVGVIGPNGAGKTTLFDLISGFTVPDAGSIRLRGVELTGLSPHARSWQGLGRSFQAARLVPSLSVAENLALGLERHLHHRDHLASALRLPAIVRVEEDVAWTVADLVELLGLGAYRDKLVRDLSTGTRRIVDLGMVIAHDPDLLLLDEPSSGIAQRETEALGPLLLDIRRETGCALLVIEHDMPLVTSISDRLVAMDLGRSIAAGPPAEVIEHPHVVSAYLGGDVATIQRSAARAGTS